MKYLVTGELPNGDCYHEEEFDNLEDAKAYFRNEPSHMKYMYENNRLVVRSVWGRIEVDLVGINE